LNRSLEVVLAPRELGMLRASDLGDAVCVVFDVLRATTSMVTALAHGAEAIVPVGEIAEALEARARRPDVLLAGERDGVRIRGDLAGGVDFDLGNSPREFTADRVRGRTIAMTTTNGTRALRACAGAREVLVAGFVNLGPTIERLRAVDASRRVLVCSGTHDEPALEDVLAAGAMCDALWDSLSGVRVSDGAHIARTAYRACSGDLLRAASESRNGARLLAIPELRDDVPLCFERDRHPLVAAMGADGAVRRCDPAPRRA
jgi:2-phosphosulfolactate phosphatase